MADILETPPAFLEVLPDDLAFLCLVRVPARCHGVLRSVCTSWRALVGTAEFYAKRRELQVCDCWLVVVAPKRALRLPSVPSFWVPRRSPELVRELGIGQALHLHLYDLGARRWLHNAAPLPQEIATNFNGFGAAAVGGRVLIFGGYEDSAGISRDAVWAWDPLRNGWERRASMLTARSYMAAGVVGGRLCVAGGWAGEEVASCEAYDYAADSWRACAHMREPHTFHQHREVIIGGKLYAGRFADGAIVVYDPAQPLPPTPPPAPGLAPQEGPGLGPGPQREPMVGPGPPREVLVGPQRGLQEDVWVHAMLSSPGDKAWVRGQLYGLDKLRSSYSVNVFDERLARWRAVAVLPQSPHMGIGPALLVPAGGRLHVVGKRNLSIRVLEEPAPPSFSLALPGSGSGPDPAEAQGQGQQQQKQPEQEYVFGGLPRLSAARASPPPLPPLVTVSSGEFEPDEIFGCDWKCVSIEL